MSLPTDAPHARSPRRDRTRRHTLAGALALTAAAAIAVATPTAAHAATTPSRLGSETVEQTARAAKVDLDAGLLVKKWKYGPSVHQQSTVTRDPKFHGRRPAVLFIHGGAWSSGSQAIFANEARVWARRGWVVVNLDYRLKVQGKYMFDDVRTVILHYRAQAYVDKSRVILYGSSAGGHLAAWVGSALGISTVTGVIAWSPVASPYNEWRTGTSKTATPHDASLGEKARKFFSYDWQGTSALTYSRAKKTPPMWIAGSDDEFVDWGTQGGALCAGLGKKCTPHLMSGAGHGLGVAALHPELTESAREWAATLIRS